MNKKNKQLAQHMLHHCERIEKYLARCDNNFEMFMENDMLQDAVTMQLLAMGELSSRFSDEFKSGFSQEIDWRNLKQLRNVLAHRYNTINYEVIWDITISDVPIIKDFFEKVVNQKEKIIECAELEEEELEL